MLETCTLNNTYKCAHINRLISPQILARSFSNFQQIYTACELNNCILFISNKIKKVKTANAKFKLMVKSKFTFSQYFSRDQASTQIKYHNIPQSNPAAASISM